MASKNGKVVCVSSVKGGVGKTILSINLAGIYHLLGKRVLLIDLDLYSGGIATCLDIKNKKDIFMLADSINNNRFTTLADYVTKYNENIDVLASPKDPRMANKVTGKYLPLIFENCHLHCHLRFCKRLFFISKRKCISNRFTVSRLRFLKHMTIDITRCSYAGMSHIT